jgi:alkylation response protein AidB-like acyl-CoA dehydrogenase
VNEQRYENIRHRFLDGVWAGIDPLADEIEETGRIPYDRLFPVLRHIEAFGLLIPEQYGGLGLSVRQYLPLIAEVAKSHGGVRALVHVHNSMAHAVAAMASPEQAAAVLPGAANGDLSIAFALTEPDHGTGADLGTTARRENGKYVVNGVKHLITNSDFASHFILFAKTAAGRDERAVSALLVERDTPGLSIEPLPETMGCRGGQHGRLTFTDAVVDAHCLLGEEGQGLARMEEALEISRVFVAASSLGTAERALELSVDYAKRRVTFGRPIAERQAVQRYLAEMATDVYALRQMLADAAAKWDAGQRIPAEASMCKLFGLEAAGRVTDRALLVHGGLGYTRTFPLERLYRDARLNWLEEGTPTIQQLVIAREVLTGAAAGNGG